MMRENDTVSSPPGGKEVGKPGQTKMRAKRRMWSEEEECSLREGVLQHGEGRWKKIQSDPNYPFLRTNRSSVDLKDKWRVISRKRRKLEEQTTPNPVQQHRRRPHRKLAVHRKLQPAYRRAPADRNGANRAQKRVAVVAWDQQYHLQVKVLKSLVQ